MGQTTKGIVYPSDPSAQADLITDLKDMADSIDGIMEDVNNKVTEISSDSTDTEYPSAKCVFDNIDVLVFNITQRELVSNKVTSISSSSTDTQYPSAKCVYDIVGDINSALDTINGEVI